MIPVRNVVVALGLLVTLFTAPVAGQTCAGISTETAQHVFDRVVGMSLGAGYRFDSVTTDKSIFVKWSLNGTPCPPIRIDVVNCASMFGLARLAIHAPAELSERCPELGIVVRDLAETLAGEHPVGQHVSLPPSARPWFLAIVALVVVSGLLIGRSLALPTSAVVAWIAFISIAALPFWFNAQLATTGELAFGWVAFALLLGKSVARATRDSADRLWLLGLLVFGSSVHTYLSSRGPGDLHLNLASIWSSQIELRWGPAPVSLFRLLALAPGGLHDTGIVRCNILLSAVVPVLIYLIVAELGLNRIAAFLAASVTAVHPLLIAFSGVLERQPTFLVAACGSVLALIDFLRNQKPAALIAFVVGAVLATTSRPEGAQVFVLFLAALLVTDGTRRARECAGLAFLVLGLLAFAYTRFALELQPSGQHPTVAVSAFLWTILLDPNFTPVAWIVGWIAGVALGIRSRAAWFVLISCSGLDVLWRSTGVYLMFVEHPRQIASSRYEMILLVPFALGLALLFQVVLKTSMRSKISFACAFLTLTYITSTPSRALLRPFTIDYEYRFLRKHALQLPADAQLYILDAPADDVGFLDAHLVGNFVDSKVDFKLWSERHCEVLRTASTAYLYIGSSCGELNDDPLRPLPPAFPRWLVDCRTLRSRLSNNVVEEIEVPARKMSWHNFKEQTVRLGLYKLSDRSLCDLR
ncbi:MAG TPA: glycosyltransferase family 39 protein [Candidatus Acidoferrales bacterium]|nr:glycosyltransferase family 39 protein [Candidatus Acidoferrales bacterium]